MALVLDIPVLRGALVRLEPLSLVHSSDPAEAAKEDRSTFGHTWVPDRAGIYHYIGHELQIRKPVLTWWALEDSNLRPQPCEGCALTN